MFHSEVGICAHDASVDHLDVHALGSCFQRFDLFNQKYNPFGQRTLRDVFLKTDNYIEGTGTQILGAVVAGEYRRRLWVSPVLACKFKWARVIEQCQGRSSCDVVLAVGVDRGACNDWIEASFEYARQLRFVVAASS